jgi:hypothetical protein
LDSAALLLQVFFVDSLALFLLDLLALNLTPCLFVFFVSDLMASFL